MHEHARVGTDLDRGSERPTKAATRRFGLTIEWSHVRRRYLFAIRMHTSGDAHAVRLGPSTHNIVWTGSCQQSCKADGECSFKLATATAFRDSELFIGLICHSLET